MGKETRLRMSVIEKLNQRAEAANSLLCVGLDSAIEKLPKSFSNEPYPQFTFNRYIIEQTHTYAAAYKLNTAFYEARGAQGWEEMAQTVAYLRENHPDILTICDAKRADIGNTNAAYVHAFFDEIGFDAITLHPYLGREALRPFLDRADRAVIILCHTSNAGADEFQSLKVGGRPLWAIVAEQVARYWNDNQNCMLVVGATYPKILAQVRAMIGDMPLLVPGVGAQGGDVAAVVRQGVDSHGRGLLINSSRGIIFADDPATAAQQLRDAINQHRA